LKSDNRFEVLNNQKWSFDEILTKPGIIIIDKTMNITTKYDGKNNETNSLVYGYRKGTMIDVTKLKFTLTP